HENQTLKFIQGMSQIQVRDLPEGVLFGNIESIFSRMLQQMGQMLPQATAVFINSFEELDPITTTDLKTKFNKFLNIGPSNLISPQPTSDTSGCLSWLDKQKAASVAYISFGSVTTPPPNELKALAEALGAGGVPFIWSLKDMSKVHLPNGFLEKTKVNGMIVPWAPQLDILAHGAVGVFITHCGWNSLLESISGGVPMICRPFFGDQKLNGRVVEDVLEVGLKIEGGIFTKNGVVSSLDLILFQEKGKKMREKMKVLKELAIKAVGPKGSSTRNFESLLQIVSRPKIDADKE
ncbi:anthocyanidin 3-O-glucosyltransferase UFGT-like, partial [Fagus crenata]